MADAITDVHSRHKDHTLPPIYYDNDEPLSYIQPLDVSRRALYSNISTDRLLLLNFSPGTDKTGLRKRIWQELCPRKLHPNFTFTKCIGKLGGVDIKGMPTVYERNRHYPFWLSPRGNGLDCHRTWEAIYLDIIPVVWNSSLNILYEHLPVLIINDVKDLTEKLLRDTLTDISRKKLSKEPVYQYEKLRNAYWRRMILNQSRHVKMTRTYQRTNQCWSAYSQTFLSSLFRFFL
jgi:hypothetical protein